MEEQKGGEEGGAGGHSGESAADGANDLGRGGQEDSFRVVLQIVLVDKLLLSFSRLF